MKIGCIGAGNMGFAILKGLVRSGIKPDDIKVYDPAPAAKERVENAGMIFADSEAEASAQADVILLAVKPIHLESAATAMGDVGDAVVLSIAAGQKAELVASYCNTRKVVRAMPNMPALIGKGITAFTCLDVSEDEKEMVKTVLSSIGDAVEIKEDAMDAFTAAGGSAPAFVFEFIEGLAEGAILEGMDESMALEVAAKTVEGAAALLLVDGRKPGELTDAVCSPGGTTIEGIKVLREADLKGLAKAAVSAAAKRSREL